jgi:hypothetical protein
MLHTFLSKSNQPSVAPLVTEIRNNTDCFCFKIKGVEFKWNVIQQDNVLELNRTTILNTKDRIIADLKKDARRQIECRDYDIYGLDVLIQQCCSRLKDPQTREEERKELIDDIEKFSLQIATHEAAKLKISENLLAEYDIGNQTFSIKLHPNTLTLLDGFPDQQDAEVRLLWRRDDLRTNIGKLKINATKIIDEFVLP